MSTCTEVKDLKTPERLIQIRGQEVRNTHYQNKMQIKTQKDNKAHGADARQQVQTFIHQTLNNLCTKINPN